MNKIQRAIYETKASLKYLKRQRTDLNGQIHAYKEHLEGLKSIEEDDSYPNVEALQEILNVVNLEPNGTGITNVMNFPDFDKNKTHTYVKYPDTQNTI